MRLQIVSDTHLEFYYRMPHKVARTIGRIPKLADVLMLAGDIHTAHRLFTEIVFHEFCSRWEKVFYVPGNHDYWSRYDFEPKLASDRKQFFLDLEKKFSNLTVLRSGKVVEYGGKRFLGDTMWFPDLPLNVGLKNQMNDFELIQGLEPWVYQENNAFRYFLEEELRKGDIVMTHHLPSYACISPNMRTDPFNPFYVSDMSNLISYVEPALWIHGHNHTFEDQTLGKTRVVSCPKGYPQDLVKGFDKGLAVDI